MSNANPNHNPDAHPSSASPDSIHHQHHVSRIPKGFYYSDHHQPIMDFPLPTLTDSEAAILNSMDEVSATYQQIMRDQTSGSMVNSGILSAWSYDALQDEAAVAAMTGVAQHSGPNQGQSGTRPLMSIQHQNQIQNHGRQPGLPVMPVSVVHEVPMNVSNKHGRGVTGTSGRKSSPAKSSSKSRSKSVTSNGTDEGSDGGSANGNTSRDPSAPAPVPGKRQRGRPHLGLPPEVTAERRRAQVRIAQRAYRLRREATVTSLEQRNRHLEEVMDGMTESFLKLQDAAMQLSQADARPDVTAQLQRSTEEFLAFAKSTYGNVNADFDGPGSDMALGGMPPGTMEEFPVEEYSRRRSGTGEQRRGDGRRGKKSGSGSR